LKLYEPRPAKVSFRCDCAAALHFSTLDRPGDRYEVPCAKCGRVWEQRVVVHENGRGWERKLLKRSVLAPVAVRFASPASKRGDS